MTVFYNGDHSPCEYNIMFINICICVLYVCQSVLLLVLQAGAEHSGMEQLTSLMADIPYATDQRTFPASFNPSCLLPS